MSDVWLIGNKRFPKNDYRVFLVNSLKEHCQVKILCPGKPESICDDNYLLLDAKEGVGLSDIKWIWQLLNYFWRARGRKVKLCFYSTKLILIGPILGAIFGFESYIVVTGKGRVFSSERLIYTLLQPVYRVMLNLSSALCEKVFFQNSEDLTWFKYEFHKQVNKGLILRSGIDYQSYARHSSEFLNRKLDILMVARLMPDKGIDDFLRIAEAFKSNNNVDFTLVGPVSVGFEGLQSKVHKFHEKGIVNFKGEVHGEDLVALYKKHQIFMFTSYAEGMPRVLIEAGFNNMYVIAYDIGATRDLLSDGRGQLVPLKDSSAICEHIQKIIKYRDDMPIVSEKFKRFVEVNYSATSHVTSFRKAIMES